MEFEYLEFTVDENGIKTEAHGFKGRDCLKATKGIEERLGGSTDRQMKPQVVRPQQIKMKGNA